MIGGMWGSRRRVLTLGLALVALTVGAACGGSSDKTSSVSVPYTVFSNGEQKAERPYGLVVRDRNALFDVLTEPGAQLAFDRYPWRQDAVVLVFAGPQPTPGYRIVIDGLRRSGDRLVAVAHVEPPPADQAAPQVLAYPYTALQVTQNEVAEVRSVSVIWKS